MGSELPPISRERRLQGQRLEQLVRERWRDPRKISGLSEELGVSRATVYSWFKGTTSPDTAALTRLAKLLWVSPSELLPPYDPHAGPEAMVAQALAADTDMETRMLARAPEAWRTPASPAQYRMSDLEIRVQGSAPRLRRSLAVRGLSQGSSLLAVIGGQRVMSCDADDPIGPVAQRMLKLNYSQVPVRDRRAWVALLTTDTIARWTAARPGRSLGFNEKAPVREVLPYTEEPDNFRIVRADAPIGAVLSVFEEFADAGRVVGAILVTKTGRPDEDLLGIVNASDLPMLRGASHP